MDKKVVYIVQGHYDYEGFSIIAVFTTEKKAKDFIKNYDRKNSNYDDIDYESFEVK